MRLNEVASITMGQSPNSQYYNSEGVGYPFLQGCAQFGKTYPGTSIFCSMPMRIAPTGSILYSVRAPVGEINIADQDYCIGRGLAAVEAMSIDSSLLYYLLLYERRQLTRIAQGSTFEAISSADLAECIIPDLGDLQNQTAIADILTTVDRAIEQTEALIAKQRRIKAGLLHDLLTRGIDEHGHLRDPSTHHFKPSPVGLVPEEWEVVTLGSVVDRNSGVIQTGPFGSQLHAEEYTKEGVPFVMPQDISPEGTLLLDSAAKIPQHRAHDLRRHLLKENDVLFARRGDLSRCAAVQVSGIAVAGSGCMLVRVPKSAMIGEWLVHVYKHERSQRQIMARAVGSTMVNLNSTLLRDLVVMLPEKSEQERILHVLSKAQECDLAIQQECNKLATLKAGLMQDLLSGRVLVAGLIGE